jgi:hypothetical protein
LRLYTLWWTGTQHDVVIARIHCTGGDILITTATLDLAEAVRAALLPVSLSDADNIVPLRRSEPC